MTTSPDFAATHPVDLRDKWRGRTAAKLFGLAPGIKSTGVIKSVVTWSWRPTGTDHSSASRVQVWRECGRLYVRVSDVKPGSRLARIESPRKPLRSWEQLEALVAALAEGERMVPRVDSIEPVRVAS